MKYLLALLLVSLIGCSPLVVDTKPVDKPALNLPNPDPIVMDKIQFITVTKENAPAVFAALEKKGLKAVIIGLSGTDFKILAMDLNKIKDFMILQQDLINKYKSYYEGK